MVVVQCQLGLDYFLFVFKGLARIFVFFLDEGLVCIFVSLYVSLDHFVFVVLVSFVRFWFVQYRATRLAGKNLQERLQNDLFCVEQDVKPCSIYHLSSRDVSLRMLCCWLQVWVGCISRGPSNSVLLGTYEHADTFAYQDEIGQVLLTVCKVDRQIDR